MTEPEPEAEAELDDGGGTPTWARTLVFTAAALALLLVGATIGMLIQGARSEPEDPAPTPNAVDIGFCQDMSVHHRQAVELADIARVRGHSEDVRSIAYDVSTTQNGQTGRMQGWLTLWDAPAQAPGELMTWMANGHNHGDVPSQAEAEDGAPMPGMATNAEIRKLSKLTGRKFDVYFLQLMLRHHQGGSAMAAYAAVYARIPAVKSLAQSMVDSQGAEMLTMKDMLTTLGAKPLPER